MGSNMTTESTSHYLWGAEKREWDVFARLAMPDMRPVVSNPTVPVLSSVKSGKPMPAGKRYSKVPSRKYLIGDVQAVSGFSGWPTYVATPDDIRTWSIDIDLGFGLVGNLIKAIDIDIEDEGLSGQIDDWFCDYLGADLPFRSRSNSSRKMLIYRLSNPEKGRGKVVVPVETALATGEASRGQVEFIFDKAFFVAGGRHHTGARQVWTGLPDSYEALPVLDNDKVTDMINAFIARFAPATGPVSSVLKDDAPLQRSSSDVDATDDLYRFVCDSEWFRGHAPDGSVYVRCPWEETHSTKDGKPDETVFFPRGLGGRDSAGFKCMHTSHGQKTIADFINAIGYIPNDFPMATRERSPLVLFERNKAGQARNITINLTAGLRWMNGYEFSLRYDAFEDVIWCRGDALQWQRLTDNHYTEAALKLYSLCQIDDPSITKLRPAVEAVARENQIDSGRMWLENLQWDGVDRIGGLIYAAAVEDTPYTRAAFAYLLTSMAGRLMNPDDMGVKADMSLIFSSRQGDNKSSFIAALSPRKEWYSTISLDGRDDNTTRLMRGKAVLEIAELRGLMGRDSESLRAWMTQVSDDLVKKFQENTTRYYRRCIFIGTTNHRRFLIDPTGNRRWLPMYVASYGGTGRKLDVEWMEVNRAQLWAQGWEMYRKHGVMWQEAQRLAADVERQYRMPSMNEMRLMAWIEETGATKFTMLDAMNGANIFSKYPQELEACLYNMGFRERDGLWSTSLY